MYGKICNGIGCRVKLIRRQEEKEQGCHRKRISFLGSFFIAKEMYRRIMYGKICNGIGCGDNQ